MSKFKYEAPILTRYGKPNDFLETGSVIIASDDVTGDGVSDDLYDTNNDGIGDVVRGGANGGLTPVTFIGNVAAGNPAYDGPDPDALAGIAVTGGNNLVPILFTGGNPALETSDDDGWNDPARD